MSASFAKAIIPRSAIPKVSRTDTGWEVGWSFAVKTDAPTRADGTSIAGPISEATDSPAALRHLPDGNAPKDCS
jgi:hypothetical protein